MTTSSWTTGSAHESWLPSSDDQSVLSVQEFVEDSLAVCSGWGAHNPVTDWPLFLSCMSCSLFLPLESFAFPDRTVLEYFLPENYKFKKGIDHLPAHLVIPLQMTKLNRAGRARNSRKWVSTGLSQFWVTFKDSIIFLELLLSSFHMIFKFLTAVMNDDLFWL